ncbi:hypothetical protein FA15DRAFT_206842 [Coprinopsis marcescibilis]|uniref:Uncharacterized protein n=1 Tax=Coprinopsis marcescibilis TaxID=230819 RepID=A0A5C3LBR4_COPMA|nr:hypothetical protein FA15DRAFT_206842 [Coprinopsis marcescibilis]
MLDLLTTSPATLLPDNLPFVLTHKRLRPVDPPTSQNAQSTTLRPLFHYHSPQPLSTSAQHLPNRRIFWQVRRSEGGGRQKTTQRARARLQQTKCSAAQQWLMLSSSAANQLGNDFPTTQPSWTPKPTQNSLSCLQADPRLLQNRTSVRQG